MFNNTDKSKEKTIFSVNTFPYFVIILSIMLVDIFDYQQPITYLPCLLVLAFGYVCDVFITRIFRPTLQITDDGIDKVMPFIKKRTEFIKFQQITDIELDTSYILTKLTIQTDLSDSNDSKVIYLKDYIHSDKMLSLIVERSPIKIKEVNHDNPLANSVLQEEVTARTIIIIGVGIVLLVLAMLIDWQFVNAIHLGSESWGKWLLVSIPMAVFVSYLFLRKEIINKAPFLSALVAGLVLGVMANYLVLNINRAINERTVTQVMQLQVVLTKSYKDNYDDEDGFFSKPIREFFHLPKKAVKVKHKQNFGFTNPMKAGVGSLSITDEWKGYNSDLKVGETYPIKVKKGHLHDFYLTKDSFKE